MAADDERSSGPSTASQLSFHACMTSCLNHPIYPLKAVARVRIRSGLPTEIRLLWVDPGGVVVAVFSRRILGWRVTTTKHTGMVTDALQQALQGPPARRRRVGRCGVDPSFRRRLAIRVLAFTAELIDAGIAGSIGTVGDALDNALCECTIGLFKTEAINLTWTNRRDVEWQVARWIRWYNTDRLHSSKSASN
jgi:transposase InsO family protein